MTVKGGILSPLQEEIDARQQAVEEKLLSRAPDITGVNSPQQADIRDLLPPEDLQSGADNGWNGTDHEWVQSGLAADQEQDVYDIDSNQRAQDKIFAIYGVANVAGDPLTTMVRLEDGTGAGFFELNVQTLEVVELSDVILFEQDVIFGPTEDGTLVQWPNAAGDDALIWLGKVAEATGQTLTPRSREEPATTGRR